jgi:hypothetical protein
MDGQQSVAMLERVALHQTRLRTPGLFLDARGIALGPRGLVLFPSYDRLVTFVAMYTEEHTLDDLAPTLRLEIAKTALGTKELLLSFALESSDQLDAIADLARLAGAHAFTGAGRHWVAYRDAAAPFGYDVTAVEPGDAAVFLYHPAFRQAYAVERPIDLRSLLLRLRPRRDPAAGRGAESGPKLLLAEWGLGASMLQFLRRSDIPGRVALAEWPPASELSDEPIRRYLFDLPSVPERLFDLLTKTPGLALFDRVAHGAAVQVGFRHPVRLGAVPSFRGPALALFRGGEGPDGEPLELTHPPAFGQLEAFAKLALAAEPERVTKPTSFPTTLRVPLRIVPSSRPSTAVAATLIPPDELPLLRRLLYALGPQTLARSRFAVTNHGAFVLIAGDGSSLPLGVFHSQLTSRLFLPLGHDVAPAVSADVLEAALDAPPDHLVVLRPHGPALAIPLASFVDLGSAIAEGFAWAPLPTLSIDVTLAQDALDLRVEPLGLFPLGDVADAIP